MPIDRSELAQRFRFNIDQLQGANQNLHLKEDALYRSEMECALSGDERVVQAYMEAGIEHNNAVSRKEVIHNALRICIKDAYILGEGK